MPHFSQGNTFSNGKNKFLLLSVIYSGLNPVRVELQNKLTNQIYEKKIDEFIQALNDKKIWMV
jgi:hypothetical protein